MTTNSTAATANPATVINGVDVDQVSGMIETVQADEAFAAMQFRVRNQWIDGGLNRSSIKEFYAACQEDDTRDTAFTCDADEPAIIAGADSAPNPMEFVLHGLAGCLTTTMVYHAAVQGIGIDAIESELEGDMDVRGLFGLSDTVRKGYHHVRVKMRVRSEADAETLKQLAMFSPVFDIVSNSLPVDLVIEKQ
jgi:uncharacterized OsmC-like protein